MSELLVWVEDWQYECCGDQFAIGSELDWELSASPERDYLTTVLGAELGAAVTHVEDRHDVYPDPHAGTTARVTRIRGVRCDFGPDPRYPNENAITALPGTAVLKDVESADSFRRSRAGLRFVGFLVDLVAD